MNPKCTSLTHWAQQKCFKIQKHFVRSFSVSGWLVWNDWRKITVPTAIFDQRHRSWWMRIVGVWWNLLDEGVESNIFVLSNLFEKWVLTVTSINFTNFQTLCELIRARSCNFVPMGTAWSTGNSFWFIIACCCFVWFLRCAFSDAKLELIRPMGGASLYSATSYSRRPGVSSTTPDTRAPCGLSRKVLIEN